MNSAQERIAWVIRFTEMDLSRLRQGDWLNLEEDMRAFTQWSASQMLNLKDKKDKNVPALQKEVRQVLQSIAFANTQPSEPGVYMVQGGIKKDRTGMSHSFRLSLDADVFLTFEYRRAGDFPLRFFSMDLTDAFLFALGVALSQIDATYLRQCPTCFRLFLAGHGRQRFCSTRCKAREALKRFRERHREELKEKARAKYGQKVRKKPRMKNVKIGTNQKRKTQPKEV